MDADYERNRDREDAPTMAFEPSLIVWATVMSRPTQDRAIVDAGLKTLAFDSGPPVVCDEPAATYERASDEHGRLGISGVTNRLNTSDKVRLIPRPLRSDRSDRDLARQNFLTRTEPPPSVAGGRAPIAASALGYTRRPFE